MGFIRYGSNEKMIKAVGKDKKEVLEADRKDNVERKSKKSKKGIK